jgi:hypothetical protein
MSGMQGMQHSESEFPENANQVPGFPQDAFMEGPMMAMDKMVDLHSLRHALKLRRVEHRQKSGGLQRGQDGFTALLVNGDSAWKRGRHAHVLFENLLRLLRLTDLENEAFLLELHALLRHGLFEVMNLHDAKVIGLDGSMQGSRNFTHGFVCGYFDQHGFTSCSTVHFTGAS